MWFLSIACLSLWAAFIQGQAPVLMALSLVGLSLMLGMMTAILFFKWSGVALVMIFAGGMMISFLYITSLSMNLKISLPPMKTPLLILLVLLGLLGSATPTVFPSSPASLSPNLCFSQWSAPLIFFLVSILLLVLMIAVKLTENFKGALVKKF